MTKSERAYSDDPDQRSLTEVLASRGWTHRKEKDDQRQTVYSENGERIGSFTAREAWEYLKQHPSTLQANHFSDGSRK
jgi:hypothetical protein